MDSISELRHLTPPPVALAKPGGQTVKASMAIAEPKSVAVAVAPEPSRSQAAEQRLRSNRPEEGPLHDGTGTPEAELSFGDFLDLINPLQHIPIVSTIYRAITGDEISGPAKIMGGMLFGGPIGFITSLFDTIVEQATGRSVGETVLAAFVDQDPAREVQVAETQDLELISAQDDASPLSGHRASFGSERGAAAAIAVAPGPLPAVTVVDASGQPAVTGAQPPAQNAPSLTVATPRPQAATAPGIGLDRIKIDGAAATVPMAAPVVAVELIAAGAPKPGNQLLVPNLATAERGFAERMLEALDKYQVLASERIGDNNRAPHGLDLEL